MNKLIAILYVLYFISYMLGCAYNGDVYIYSPQGDGTSIEKAADVQAGYNQ